MESPRISTHPMGGSRSPSPKAFRSIGLAGPSGHVRVCVCRDWGVGSCSGESRGIIINFVYRV